MQEKVYTLAEIASNDGCNGNRVWIIIKGVVYDVTDFVDDHPGGGGLITEQAGGDATSAFYQAGHSSDAVSDLKKYRIGVVAKAPTVENKDEKTENELQTTKSEKRRRLKFLFCV